MIAARIVSHPALMALHGSITIIVEASILLVTYAAAFAWPQARAACSIRPRFSSQLGAIGSVIQVIHLLVERFCSLTQTWDGIVTLAFMLATFLVWGYAGYRARGLGFSFAAACLASIWSAMVTMAIAVLAGALLEFFVAPIPLDEIKTWAEFQRSGWNDLSAFSIANTIEDAATHLLIGPLVACIFGLLGFALHRTSRAQINA
jgi:hypothetical protein